MRWWRWSIGISMSEEARERSFQGLGVSGGIVMGPLFLLRERQAVRRAFAGAEPETRLFREAVETAKVEIEALIAAEDQLAGDILEFQLALLDDDDFLQPVAQAIAAGTPCDAAWRAAVDAEIADYRKGGDDVLAARAADLADLKARVLRALNGSDSAGDEIPAGAILVAGELTPSGFLGLDWARVAGAATLGGSPTAHVSILARARGVNLVVGLGADLDTLEDGAPAILDAGRGTLIVDPTANTVELAKVKLTLTNRDQGAITALLPATAMTASGEPVKILMNIDEPDRFEALPVEHCDGVGLTRTEFLFKDGHLPNEDEQLAFYRRLIAWAKGRPVTIRTLDAGGDKPIPGVTIDGETNPFLGVRGLRLSLARPELFRIQLRALARAAALGPIKVMMPMVTIPGELDEAREMLRAEVAELERAGVAATQPPVGMMVEVPAAALTAEDFDADFYSIGSNDLIQYAMAAARDNARLAALADPTNPAVLELIKRTVDAAKRRGVEVGLCGDMASAPHLIAALLDTGLRSLSCAPAQVGPVKLAVRRYGSD
jgi:phosphoenolpyruvate-protein phosphotransferase (PTS system enzyme I)